MAMGRGNQRQQGLWVATADLPHTAAHPFYRRLGELLDEHGFDEFAEQRCEKFYAARMGRPSLAPGSCFHCLLIGDLEGIEPIVDFDRAPVATARNQRRIDILFEEGAYELDDRHRPPCHRKGGHSYKSIYGRLRGDRPSQTVTTGFRCMGQGRYVHPTQRRTLTPHEAARLQFIPDFVDFSGLSSTSVARLIGNAVPPKMAYTILLSLLSQAG